MKNLELATDYFDRHSVSEECHIVDGRVFHTLGYAISFASEHKIEHSKIESFKRDSVVAENAISEEVESENNDEVADINVGDIQDIPSQEEIIETGDAVFEEFKTFDIENGDYNAVKAFVKHFNIETADQKGETLKAALTEYKSKL